MYTHIRIYSLVMCLCKADDDWPLCLYETIVLRTVEKEHQEATTSEMPVQEILASAWVIFVTCRTVLSYSELTSVCPAF